MNPAMALPIKIDGNAHLNRMLSKAAIRLPLHTPVPGRGIATKIKSPHAPYFCILGPFLFKDLSAIFSTIFLNGFVFFRYWKTGLTVNRIIGAGSMLPANPNIAECIGERPRDIPSGIAPLSSMTGRAAAKRIVSSIDSVLNNSFSIIDSPRQTGR